MNPLTRDDLVRNKCSPCEGGIAPLSRRQAEEQLRHVEGWSLAHDGQRIRRSWTVRNFMAGIEFFTRVAAWLRRKGIVLDLHLEGYRQVAIEIWTHAIGGLSTNDFILAAKINQLPVQVKK